MSWKQAMGACDPPGSLAGTGSTIQSACLYCCWFCASATGNLLAWAPCWLVVALSTQYLVGMCLSVCLSVCCMWRVGSSKT
jgi:hypothetical protein